MSIEKFQNHTPQIHKSVYTHASAIIIGQVSLAEDCSVWPCAILRGDVHAIQVGKCCSIQDGSVIHGTHDSKYNPGGFSISIGDHVTIGHKAILHGCKVDSEVLIGMGAIIMDGANIEKNVIVAAGSLVSPNSQLKSGFLYRGSPAKQIRELTPSEMQFFKYTTSHYKKLKDEYL